MAKKMYLAGFIAGGLMAGAVAVTALSGAVPVLAQDRDDARASAPRQPPKCLDGQNTGRFHVVDEKTLLIYDRSGNAYKVGVGGPCRSMTDFDQFGFEFRGNTQICRAYDATLLRSQNGERPLKCIINSVQPISREEAEHLDPSN